MVESYLIYSHTVYMAAWWKSTKNKREQVVDAASNEHEVSGYEFNGENLSDSQQLTDLSENSSEVKFKSQEDDMTSTKPDKILRQGPW